MLTLLLASLASLAIGASVGRYLGYKRGEAEIRARLRGFAEDALSAYPTSRGGRAVVRAIGGTVPKRERVTVEGVGE